MCFGLVKQLSIGTYILSVVLEPFVFQKVVYIVTVRLICDNRSNDADYSVYIHKSKVF